MISLALAPAPSNSHRGAPPSRISKRTVALVLLCLQNASVSLLTRLSRTSTRAGSPLYEPAVAVFTAECIKCTVSLAMLARQRQAAERRVKGGKGEGSGRERGIVEHAGGAVRDLVRDQKAEMVKLAVPAALYALQNTLLYTALSNLDAATYQTTYQLKLLTTALFSILFFHRSLSPLRWCALVLLALGVAIVQLESNDMSASTARLRGDAREQDPRKGFAAILAACVSSGLAGAWFEWVLKSPAVAPSPLPPPPPSSRAPPPPSSPSSPTPPSPKSPPLALRANSPSLWARNLQLSVPSLLFSLVGVALCGPVSGAWTKGGLGAALGEVKGLWTPFDALVWAVVLNQALGGLLVAMVVRFADSVAKGFATSIAIVLSTLASAALFSLVPGPQFLLGAGLVIASTVLYSLDKD
ncbi:hypothetical protein JCM8208_004279 [Rhodotorula glutinis]